MYPIGVAAYLRKSRLEENDPAAETLARHREMLEGFAKRNDIEITEYYEEVVSGESLYARPMMLKLLSEVDRYEGILCMDIDRLGRGNMKEQGIILETIKAADVKIITPVKTYDLNNEMDETYSEFQAFMARQELKIIKKRLARGLRKSAEEGYHMGEAPYGYRLERVDKRSLLMVNEDEAKWVKYIFQSYLDGVGTNSICNRLNEMGVSPRRNNPWPLITVKRILSNEVYCGLIVYGKKMINKENGKQTAWRPRDQWIISEGKHEPLVSRDDFDRVQEIIAKRYNPPLPNQRELKNPMAGLIKCQKCGKALGIFSYAEKDKRYLLCKTKGCVRMASLPAIEQSMLGELRKHLSDLKAEAASPDGAVHDSCLPQLEADMAKCLKQRESLFNLVEQGIYTTITFKERMAVLEEKIASLQTAIDEETVIAKTYAHKVDQLIPRIQHLLCVYDDLSVKERNDLLRRIVKRITYYKASDASPYDFTLWVTLVD